MRTRACSLGRLLTEDHQGRSKTTAAYTRCWTKCWQQKAHSDDLHRPLNTDAGDHALTNHGARRLARGGGLWRSPSQSSPEPPRNPGRSNGEDCGADRDLLCRSRSGSIRFLRAAPCDRRTVPLLRRSQRRTRSGPPGGPPCRAGRRRSAHSRHRGSAARRRREPRRLLTTGCQAGHAPRRADRRAGRS
jgi:hypothetical protein